MRFNDKSATVIAWSVITIAAGFSLLLGYLLLS